jgi:hypothetical protein
MTDDNVFNVNEKKCIDQVAFARMVVSSMHIGCSVEAARAQEGSIVEEEPFTHY